MEKKNLKWYEAPAMELVDIKLQGMICTSPNTNPFDGSTSDTPEME